MQNCCSRPGPMPVRSSRTSSPKTMVSTTCVASYERLAVRERWRRRPARACRSRFVRRLRRSVRAFHSIARTSRQRFARKGPTASSASAPVHAQCTSGFWISKPQPAGPDFFRRHAPVSRSGWTRCRRGWTHSSLSCTAWPDLHSGQSWRSRSHSTRSDPKSPNPISSSAPVPPASGLSCARRRSAPSSRRALPMNGSRWLEPSSLQSPSTTSFAKP